MKKFFYSTTWKETFVYIAFWAVLFIAPVMTLHMRMQNGQAVPFNWEEAFHAWTVLTIAMVMFFIHNHFIAPLILNKRRKVIYFAASTVLLVVYLLVLVVTRPRGDHKFPEMPHEGPRKEMRMEANPPAKPHFMPHEDPDFLRQLPFRGPRELMAAMCALLLMGMNLGVKYYFKAEHDDDERKELDKKNLEQRLQYLRYQVNPHFFMNTLNNIHALVDIDPEKAKQTIVKLSKMMRYILYEGNNSLIPLQREIQFLNNYVQLMRLRYPDKVAITFDAPAAVPDLMLPPLLLIIFVENAFKHGVSYCNESFISISLTSEGGRLRFHCRNSKNGKEHDEKGGIGLTNVKKRLDLLFAQNYTLDMRDEADAYDVSLSLPLEKDEKELLKQEQHD